MLTFTAILVDGITYASWLLIVALGLTLIYGVMKILNIAHGSLYALGAYTAAYFVGIYYMLGWPDYAGFLILPLAAIGVGLVFGLVIERGILRWMYGSDPVLMLLVTYSIFLILEDVIKLIWGVDPYFAWQPYGLLGRTQIGRLFFAVYDFVLIGLAVVIGAAVWFGINRTRQGKLLVAVIHDREISQAMGINVARTFTITFVIGAMLGAMGGAFTAPSISVAPGIGVQVIVLAFAVVVTGGLGSIEGAAIGALIVGLARATAVHLLPEAELFVIYAVMALVLAFRPQGLFGQAPARKI
jgi:branched-chain amino acid transport system permease protein